jgi:hypothetical protein
VDLLPATILARVRRVYCGHRSLCEDIQAAYLIEPVRTAVAGTVAIDDRLGPEAILARLLFNLGNFLAPEPRRMPLRALVAAGLAADAIFDGPLLRHGFIADDALQPKAEAIVLRDLVRIMMRTPGVIGVRDASVRYGDHVARGADAPPIPVPPNQIPRLDTQPIDGGFPIRLIRNGIEIRPDPVRVARELDRLWTEQRRTYPLAQQYLDYFAVPRGKFRDVAIYASIQNQFPNAYGINAYGLPQRASKVRRAQAKQLKGYLLAFEQLLADFFSQLSALRLLYSTDDALTQTYFYQYLDATVPDVAPLLRKPGYREGLARIVRDSDPVVARRNRFLDLLLALYAERLDPDLMPFLAEDATGPELLRGKLALLHHLVAATRQRGRGFDYLARPSLRNNAGMEIVCRIELGLPPFRRRPLAEQIEEIGLELVDDDAVSSIGTPLDAHAETIEDTFTPVAAFADEPDRPIEGGWIDPSAGMLRGQRVSVDFLHGLAAGGDVRLGVLPGDTMTAVVCRAPESDGWRLVGRFGDRPRALAAIRPVMRLAGDLTASCRALYIVEHTLLRFGCGFQDGEPQDSAHPHPPATPFMFSFTISAVVSAATHDHRNYRTGVREVIRRNTPAHIVAEICFLRTRQMIEFERLYGGWRRALRRGDEREIAATSRRLRRFLQHVGGAAAAQEGGAAGPEETWT